MSSPGQDNEPSASVVGVQFLNQLRSCWLLLCVSAYSVHDNHFCTEYVLILTSFVFCYNYLHVSFQGLRDCCRSIRIGKILVESDADTHEARVVYARFPEDISRRKVLLMYPIMSEYSHF